MMRVAVALALAAFVALPSAARAQEHNTLAVGASISHRVSTDPDAHGDPGIGFKWRLGHSETGWGWHYGLSWYSTNLDRRIGGRDTRFGELKVRPFLGGYGYTYALTDRVSVTADVVGGFAFSSFELTPEASDAFHALPAERVSVSSGMTPVVKPEASAWIDVSRKFGVSLNVGYIVARPRITVDTSIGRESSRFRADTFSISTGLVYRIF